MQRPADQAYSQDLIQEALVSEFHPRTHEAFGEGGVHVFGGHDFAQCDLEVWPQARMVRFRTSRVAIALANQDPPVQIDPGRPFEDGSVCFVNESEDQYLTLLVQTSGEFILTGTTPRPNQNPAGASLTDDDRLGAGGRRLDNRKETALNRTGGSCLPPGPEPIERSDPGEFQQGPSVEPVRRENDDSPAYPPEPVGTPSLSGKEKHEKLRLSGTIHDQVVYRPPTPERPAHLRFALEEQTADEKRYHQVYSTKTNAERIAALQLTAGERVRVTGEPHQNRDGETSVYAYGVRRLNDEE